MHLDSITSYESQRQGWHSKDFHYALTRVTSRYVFIRNYEIKVV